MSAFWAEEGSALLARLGSRSEGLTEAEADAALARRGVRVERRPRGAVRILAAQFLNPLVLLLLVAAALSFPVGASVDGFVILAVVVMSGGLGFVQEYAAENVVATLLATVRARAAVRRGGVVTEVPLERVVPGDVVVLAAGATVPGDARVLVGNGLQVDESALTGESFPSAKEAAPVAAEAPIARRTSAVFLGTHVVSGTAEAVVVTVGRDTELGGISRQLGKARPPTAFDLGIQHFGRLLVQVSAALVLVIFAVNIYLHRPVIDAFLFALALAVGLVPELLPAIVTVNLARGARRMAATEVVVKRLSAIEDFGAIDVLCSDKTGTLTQGHIRLDAALGISGDPSLRVRELAWLNATFESGYANPIDAALREAHAGDAGAWSRVGEIPYDFVRKRLSVLVERDGRRILVTKGQLAPVLAVCTEAERVADGARVAIPRDAVDATHAALAAEGKRVLGLAYREVPVGAPVTPALEEGLVFVGLLAFVDPPRPDAPAVVAELEQLGIRLAIVTGDDHRVATHLWGTLGRGAPRMLVGDELAGLGTEALARRAEDIDVFAEMDPGQKERVVFALRHAGHAVAYLGDGINDAPALRAADVGISVDSAADVAREAADVVLRRRDLGVIASGVREGRRTMANTLKYVHYTTSANFGNMLSMAVASAFLPFLPLLPKQILLNNFLSDLPAMAIAGDRVDEQRLRAPGRWSTPEIRRFMFVFGSVSSVFDLVTFALLYGIARGDPALFRTGWFVESVLTELFVLFVLRTRLPAWRSRPGTGLTVIAGGVAVVVLALPYTPMGGWFSLVPLPAPILGLVVGVTAAYLAATEFTKRHFYR